MPKEARVRLNLKVSHTVLGRPQGFHEVELPVFPENRHRAATITPRRYSWYPRATVRPKGISNEKFNDPIGNGTHALPTCSTVSQPIAPLHTPLKQAIMRFNFIKFTKLHFKIIQMNTLNKISEHNSTLGRTKLRLTHVI